MSDLPPGDPQHGNSGGGGPVFPGPTIPSALTESEQPKLRRPPDAVSDHDQPETRHGAADLEHPDWCDPAHCTATGNRGWHRSRPVEVRGSEATDLTLTAQLTAWPDGTGVYVDLAVTLVDLEGETTTDEWPVPAELALALGRVLVSLARQATP